MLGRGTFASVDDTNTRRYFFYADTPIQVANCVSLALQGIQNASPEEHHLFIYGNFSNSQQMYDFARKSGAFKKVYLFESERIPTRELGKKQTYEELINLYYGHYFLKEIPSFVEDVFYSAMLMSCSTIVTYDIFLRLRTTNPDLEILLYEDGTGTYTGNVFRGLAFPGEVPTCVRNRLMVRAAKVFLSLTANSYHTYPITKLFVKRPELIRDDFGIEISRFSLAKVVTSNNLLSPNSIVKTIADSTILYLEPPTSSDIYGLSVDIEHELVAHDIRFSLRRHPRTLIKGSGLDSVPDCTGGLWESLCFHMNRASSTLVGFCSSSMLAPAIEFSFYPKIILLNGLIEREKSASDVDQIVQMLKTLYVGRESLISIPRTIDDFISLISVDHNG